MAAASDFLENAIQNLLWRGTSFSFGGQTISIASTATGYLALFTAAPSDSGGGTEVSGFAYARQSFSFNTSTWNASTNGLVDNINAIEWPAASGGNWGTITHWAIFDAASSGNLLWHGALSSSVTINDTDVFRFPAGTFDLSLA